MKKEFWLIILLAAIIVVLVGALAFVPAKPSPEPIKTGLVVISPKANEEVSSPLKITGYVNGDGWTGFEGQVGTVRLLNSSGQELALGILTAKGEWMTTDPVDFETVLEFQAPLNETATLLFRNENASGDPIRDKTFSLPIRLKASGETMTVKAYFGKNEITGSTCSVVFPVDRIVPKTTAVARAALEELLKGPTQAEKNAGYFSSIPEGSKLNSITIVDGEARADFNAITESGGGSCSMVERVSEINFTLKQFPTITSVKLSIDGRTGDIFQP